MKKPDVIVAVIATFCLTSAVFLVTPVTSEYDPWLDYNEDGYIGIDDIFSTASEFGAEGDPTKNVNITNWPTQAEVTVWYDEDVPLNSSVYSASGFNYLRVFLGVLWAGEPSSIEFRIYSVVWGQLPGQVRSFIAYSITLTYPRTTVAMTIPVPTENFYFYAYSLEGFAMKIYLNYCLTWA